MTLEAVYNLIGCSKQNISYWAAHAHSSQSKKSVYDVILNAFKLFGLDKVTAEELANSAGLSNEYIGGSLIDNLGYSGKIIELCRKAMISDRMLRLYNHKHPTKQTVIALAIAVNKSCDEIDSLLHKYGYCLSDSVVSDVVIKWHINHYKDASNSTQMLDEINATLEKMGLPLLMTRQ